ncbi:MAG: lipoate--protein ligase family protein, partial [Gemmatimonadales bacterium]
DRSGRAFLRLYRFTPPCLSLGRNEPALRRYDRAAIERLGLDVVRRPTGGRAVWHEHELTYAVAAPVAAFGTLRASYRAIHERLAAALRRLGAATGLAADRGAPALDDASGACFAAPVGGEVVVAGRKLVGSAQVRHGSAFLQHGSMLLDGSQERLQAISHRPSSAAGSHTTLAAILGRSVGFDEVASAVAASWGEPLTPSTQPPTTVDELLRVRTSAFRDPAWTWRR